MEPSGAVGLLRGHRHQARRLPLLGLHVRALPPALVSASLPWGGCLRGVGVSGASRAGDVAACRDIFYRDVSIPAGDTAAPSGPRG